jgi:hypothetical protein
VSVHSSSTVLGIIAELKAKGPGTKQQVKPVFAEEYGTDKLIMLMFFWFRA